MKNSEELAKHHCIQSLFHEDYGPYLSEQVKKAIDYSITGSLDEPADFISFAEKACYIKSEYSNQQPSYGFHRIEISPSTFYPLWFREQVITGVKSLTRYRRALLLIKGLRSTVCPRGHYWTRNTLRRYEETMDYITALAKQGSNPEMDLSIMILS